MVLLVEHLYLKGSKRSHFIMKSYFYESLMTEEGRSNCMVYPDPKFLIFNQTQSTQSNTMAQGKLFCSKCLHILNARTKPAGLDFQFNKRFKYVECGGAACQSDLNSIWLKPISFAVGCSMHAPFVCTRSIFRCNSKNSISGFYFILCCSVFIEQNSVVRNKYKAMIHYLKNKVGVVDFANAQGLVMF